MEEPNAQPKKRSYLKPIVLGVFALLAILAYLQLGDSLTLQSLAEQESALRAYQRVQPMLVYAVAFVLYVAITGLSLPGAAALTIAFGWFFGVVQGVIIVSFASTSGATLSFLMSRYVFRDTIQSKFGDKLQSFNAALERDGAFYLFSLRLVPAVPFFVINLVMGLTPVRLRTFWWVSQLGMLPGTAVYVYAGATVPDLQTLSDNGLGGIVSPELLAAFVLLGVFPLAVQWIVGRMRSRAEPVGPQA